MRGEVELAVGFGASGVQATRPHGIFQTHHLDLNSHITHHKSCYHLLYQAHDNWHVILHSFIEFMDSNDDGNIQCTRRLKEDLMSENVKNL